MKTPLNSPLEVGIRVLMLLAEAFPAGLDLNDLVLLDHGLLHSADLGGPESLHPPLPIRAGEFVDEAQNHRARPRSHDSSGVGRDVGGAGGHPLRGQ